MEGHIIYNPESVNDKEKLSRIVLSPRDIDPVTNYPKDTFISLRQGEEGISFLRFDYMGEQQFMESGHQRAALYNGNNKKKKYSFVGWMEGIAEEIKALAPNKIHINVNEPDMGGKTKCRLPKHPKNSDLTAKKKLDLVGFAWILVGFYPLKTPFFALKSWILVG